MKNGRRRGSWFGWLRGLVVLAAVGAPAVAQRTDFTFHMFVDPLHGDDHAAYWGNPTTQSAQTWSSGAGGAFPNAIPNLASNQWNAPLGAHPFTSSTIPLPIQGVLIQAPFPFKTITQGEGALAYIQQRILGTAPELPIVTSGNNRITRIIIHCLPGLYGPNPGNTTDPDSGLRWNGENFPIRMLHRVCLQGTSALDTIFDARNAAPDPMDLMSGGNSIIAFVPRGAVLTFPYFEETFVDGITIRSNTQLIERPSVQGVVPGNWGNGSGCGVYIGGVAFNQNLAPTVSNCFIVNNVVGVAIESIFDEEGPTPTTPFLINNTIARNIDPQRNSFGVWNGNRYPTTNFMANVQLASLNVGAARPTLLNNVLDGFGTQVVVPPVPLPPRIGPYALAGVHWDDFRLSSYIDQAAGTVVSLYNPNAWQAGALEGALTVWGEVITAANWQRYIVGLAGAPVWPAAAVEGPVAVPFAVAGPNGPLGNTVPARVASPPGMTPYAPGVDIAQFTNPASGLNVLYVNDVFRNYIDAASGQPRCQHDYRLAPTVRTVGNVAGANPLIGAGVNESPDGAANAAGNVIVGHNYFGKPTFAFPNPQSTFDFPTASEHFWDWDADGFGNPRIGRNIWVPAVANPIGDIDIGADEVGDIVISGYLNSTRIFSQDPVVGSGPITFTRPAIEHFYFGIAASTLPARPRMTSLAGEVGSW
ncbi:MAG: hypothetical protein H6837_19975, partial [Planctomycetes bacterium]|nr:hypothetical protein [Planctomycetota bacterium]